MKVILFAILGLILIGGAIFAYLQFGAPVSAPSTTISDQEKPFSFNDAGLHFEYSRIYTFETYPLQDDTDTWTSLMLVRTKDKEAADANGASEGPVAITIGIFPNPTHMSVEDWVKTDTHSNFTLSEDQKLTPQTIGGVPGVSYEHSGLYESDAAAVAHGDSLYLFEVSWADANDSIRTDFQNLLKTVQFN